MIFPTRVNRSFIFEKSICEPPLQFAAAPFGRRGNYAGGSVGRTGFGKCGIAEAAAIRFSPSEIDELDAAPPLGATEGPRYAKQMMSQIDR